MSDENHVQSAIEAGRAIERLVIRGDVTHLGPFAILDYGSSHAVIKSLEHLQDRPTRIRATVAARDADSLIKYVLAFHDGATMVFADESALTISAIIDYHHEEPSWADHVARLALTATPQWSEWIAADKKKMGQVAFAEFLEDHIQDIAEPAGAQILEIATTLEAKKSVSFSSSVRLSNGSRSFQFSEDVAGSAARGTLQIPEQFTLGLVPFDGAARYGLTTRLRYSLENSHLLLRIELVRPEDVVKSAFADIRTAIADGLKAEGILVLAAAAPQMKADK
jgi:uncharacterized protein YfdQ (DUF2303 family)